MGPTGASFLPVKKMSLLADDGYSAGLEMSNTSGKGKTSFVYIKFTHKNGTCQKADVQMTQHLCNIAPNLAQ